MRKSPGRLLRVSIVLLLTLVLAFGAFACGKSDGGKTDTKDTTAPVVTVTAENGLTNQPIKFGFTASDDVTQAANIVTTQKIMSGTSEVSSSKIVGDLFYPSSAGKYKVVVTAADEAGNTATGEKEFTVSDKGAMTAVGTADEGVITANNTLVFPTAIQEKTSAKYAVENLWLKGEFIVSFDIGAFAMSPTVDTEVFPKAVIGFCTNGATETNDLIALDFKSKSFAANIGGIWTDSAARGLEFPFGSEDILIKTVSIAKIIDSGKTYYAVLYNNDGVTTTAIDVFDAGERTSDTVDSVYFYSECASFSIKNLKVKHNVTMADGDLMSKARDIVALSKGTVFDRFDIGEKIDITNDVKDPRSVQINDSVGTSGYALFRDISETKYVVEATFDRRDAPQAGLFLAYGEKDGSRRGFAFITDQANNRMEFDKVKNGIISWPHEGEGSYSAPAVLNGTDGLTTLKAVRDGNSFYLYVNGVFWDCAVMEGFDTAATAGFMFVGAKNVMVTDYGLIPSADAAFQTALTAAKADYQATASQFLLGDKGNADLSGEAAGKIVMNNGKLRFKNVWAAQYVYEANFEILSGEQIGLLIADNLSGIGYAFMKDNPATVMMVNYVEKNEIHWPFQGWPNHEVATAPMDKANLTLKAIRDGETFYLYVNGVLCDKAVFEGFTQASTLGFISNGAKANVKDYAVETSPEKVAEEIAKAEKEYSDSKILLRDRAKCSVDEGGKVYLYFDGVFAGAFDIGGVNLNGAKATAVGFISNGASAKVSDYSVVTGGSGYHDALATAKADASKTV